VGIYFISHVGGHKYAANVMIYRRGGSEPERSGVEGEGEGEGEVREEEREGELRLVRSRSRTEKGKVGEESRGEAMQCIWLARVRPEDCEAIVRYTVLQGRVVRPERHLRGGFDRGRGLTSW
jgi:(2Fe-2S) ferredoxin